MASYYIYNFATFVIVSRCTLSLSIFTTKQCSIMQINHNLSILLLMYTWIASHYLQVQIMLLWTFLHRSLCVYMWEFYYGKYPEVGSSCCIHKFNFYWYCNIFNVTDTILLSTKICINRIFLFSVFLMS